MSGATTTCQSPVFFDNWFTTLDLLLYLKQKGILACGTIRANRLKGCPLKENKEMKAEGRGSLDFMSDMNSGMLCILLQILLDCIQLAHSRDGALIKKQERRSIAHRSLSQAL